MTSKIETLNYNIHYPDSLTVSPYSKMHVLGLTAIISVALAAIAIGLGALVAISGYNVGVFHSLAALQEGGAWALYSGGTVFGIGGGIYGIYMSFKYINYCQWRDSQKSQFQKFANENETNIRQQFKYLLAQKQVDNRYRKPSQCVPKGRFLTVIDPEIDPKDSTQAHMVLHWDGDTNYEVFLLRIWGAEEPERLENETDKEFEKRTNAFFEKKLAAEKPLQALWDKLIDHSSSIPAYHKDPESQVSDQEYQEIMGDTTSPDSS